MEKKKPRKTPPKRRPAPPVREETEYTQAQPINISRFLMRIATVVAVVVALVFGMSIFFKVEYVEVSGASKYTVEEVQNATGIMTGENLLTLNKGKVAGRILTKLPYISTVRIGIRLPDTIIIEVTEAEVSYAVAGEQETWWLISAEGKVLEKIEASNAANYSKILGVILEDPTIGQNAVAKEIPQTDPEGETHPITVLCSERLKTALEIASETENNGIYGKLASIDVSDTGNITLWYGQRYEIYLGDNTQLGKKVFSALQAVSQMGEYQTGYLDASFTTYPDEVYHKSFD